MRILISYRGIPHAPRYATGDLLTSAFRQLGHQVDVYGHQYQKGHDYLIDDLFAVELDEIYNNEYDLHIYCEMNDADQQYYELRNIPSIRKAVYWEFDTSYHIQFSIDFIKQMNFDHIFYANLEYDNFIQTNIPHSWLPYAFCPKMHQPFITQKKEIDFSIVGSPWAGRQQIADELAKEGINVDFITGLHQTEYIQALAKSKVTINYNQMDGLGLLVMRIFECMPNKVCLITNSGDGVEKVLRPGSECLIYNGIDHLTTICHMLRDDAKMCEWIADAAYERGFKEHTYKHRAEKILKELEINEAY